MEHSSRDIMEKQATALVKLKIRAVGRFLHMFARSWPALPEPLGNSDGVSSSLSG